MDDLYLSPNGAQLAELIRLFKESELALQSVLHEQIDAVLDPVSGEPILLQDAQHKLLASEARYRRLLSRNASIVFELEADGTTLYVNDTVFDVLGYHTQELLGCHWWNTLLPGSQELIDELYRQFEKGDVRGYELPFRTRAGSTALINITSANLQNPDGSLDRILGLGIYVTENEKEADERAVKLAEVNLTLLRLAELNRRLLLNSQAALAESEQANRIKVQFLAMVSHELRTPLTSIKGFATTLLAPDVQWDAENQTSFISIISDEASKMSDLVNQLIDLSQLQAGKLRIQPEQCTMTTILNTAMVQLETVAAQHHLVTDVASNLPPITADIHRIAGVIVNLVGNAAKYSPPATLITLSITQQENYVRVDVSDEGPGIPLENRERIFDAFWQAEKLTIQHIKGVGLGLAICKSIITAHHGKIWVADTPSGTTMSFQLPLDVSG